MLPEELPSCAQRNNKDSRNKGVVANVAGIRQPCRLHVHAIGLAYLEGVQQGIECAASLHRPEAADKIAGVCLLAQIQYHQASPNLQARASSHCMSQLLSVRTVICMPGGQGA